MEVDLRDFAFMPLDVVRLRDSTLAVESSGDGFRAAVLLWCVAWHQVPAASLPDDDRALAMYAGYGRDLRAWNRVRDQALRGFVQCDDGRLYHSVLAEKAVDAWDGKLRLRHRRECERIKKAAYRAKVDAAYPTFDEWKQHVASTGSDIWPLMSPGTSEGHAGDNPGDTGVAVPGESLPLKGQGIGDRGQGIGDKEEEQERPPAAGPADDGKPKRESAPKISFTTFLAQCREQGQKPIPEDHPAFDFAEDAGIPVAFIRLAWREFKHRFTTSERAKLQQGIRGWRQHFGNAVRNNWFRLWAFNPQGECVLTAAGVAHQNALTAREQRGEEGAREQTD